MKIKEYAVERIKDTKEFLKRDGIEESIRRNNYSVIEILDYIKDMCMAEVKETLERFEKKFEIYYEKNGFDEISDEYMQQIETLKSVNYAKDKNYSQRWRYAGNYSYVFN